MAHGDDPQLAVDGDRAPSPIELAKLRPAGIYRCLEGAACPLGEYRAATQGKSTPRLDDKCAVVDEGVGGVHSGVDGRDVDGAARGVGDVGPQVADTATALNRVHVAGVGQARTAVARPHHAESGAGITEDDRAGVGESDTQVDPAVVAGDGYHLAVGAAGLRPSTSQGVWRSAGVADREFGNTGAQVIVEAAVLQEHGVARLRAAPLGESAAVLAEATEVGNGATEVGKGSTAGHREAGARLKDECAIVGDRVGRVLPVVRGGEVDRAAGGVGDRGPQVADTATALNGVQMASVRQDNAGR